MSQDGEDKRKKTLAAEPVSLPHQVVVSPNSDTGRVSRPGAALGAVCPGRGGARLGVVTPHPASPFYSWNTSGSPCSRFSSSRGGESRWSLIQASLRFRVHNGPRLPVRFSKSGLSVAGRQDGLFLRDPKSGLSKTRNSWIPSGVKREQAARRELRAGPLPWGASGTGVSGRAWLWPTCDVPCHAGRLA